MDAARTFSRARQLAADERPRRVAVWHNAFVPKRAAFRAVVTDLDGTVVRADGTVSDDTIAACRALRDRGIPLIAATGRTPGGLRALASLAPYVTLATCCTGAIGYAPARRRILWRRRLSPAAVADILDCTGQHVPAAGLAAYDGTQWFMTEAYRAIRGFVHSGPATTVSRAQLTTLATCAMAICHPELSPARLAVVLTAAGLNLDNATLTNSGRHVLDVVPPGVNKAAGVRRVLAMLGVAPEQAIAFGDMPADLPMLAVAGHAVAMANAHPDVLESATSITGSVDDDGFARCLTTLGVI